MYLKKCHHVACYTWLQNHLQEGQGEKLMYFNLITRDRSEYPIATSCLRLAVCLFIFLALFISTTSHFISLFLWIEYSPGYPKAVYLKDLTG